jgi:dUTP pyrophosphatase
MKFTKTRKVKSPQRGLSTDAGIDFYVPEFTDDLLQHIKDKSLSDVTIKTTKDNDTVLVFSPGDNYLIPLGVKVQVASGEALVAFNKSGIGSKKGLCKLAEVVDEHYSGEVHLNMVNTTNKTCLLPFNTKAIQFLQLRISQTTPEEVTNEEYNTIMSGSLRGEGGFGSTGTN